MAAPVESFFEGDDSVLKSYAFDYNKITEFDNDVMWWSACIPPCFWPCAVIYPLLCGAANNRDAARAQHLALTRDGIRFVFDKHPSACRCQCFDVGRTSKTVPFDKLTDCDVQEPAGTAVCCCVQNRLNVVTVDTASGREMALRGLEDPFQFKKDVWSMKRGDGLLGVPDSIVATSMTRLESTKAAGAGKSAFFSSSSSGGGAGESAPLLPQLREQTALLSSAVGYLKVIAEASSRK